MVDTKVLIGISTGEYCRRADFWDYFMLLDKPDGSMQLSCHDRSPAHARNQILQAAIDNNATHVLLIDDDMAYKPEALKQLLSHDKDIVSGLYLGRAYPHQPMCFDMFDEQGNAFFTYLDGPKPKLMKIAAAGLGFVLIKTSILEKIEKPWVRLGELDPAQWCDDIGFFFRLWKAGIDVYCDTECWVGHIGTMVVWPKFENGEWFTGLSSDNKTQLNTPQIQPARPYEFVEEQAR